eukprot:scaffold463560_cov34-Prasinocladus_malaysianus.AAC.1
MNEAILSAVECHEAKSNASFMKSQLGAKRTSFLPVWRDLATTAHRTFYAPTSSQFLYTLII